MPRSKWLTNNDRVATKATFSISICLTRQPRWWIICPTPNVAEILKWDIHCAKWLGFTMATLSLTMSQPSIKVSPICMFLKPSDCVITKNSRANLDRRQITVKRWRQLFLCLRRRLTSRWIFADIKLWLRNKLWSSLTDLPFWRECRKDAAW